MEDQPGSGQKLAPELANSEQLAKDFIGKWPPGADVKPDAFAVGPEPVPGETSEQTRRQILRTLGVIEVAVGRGGPARTAIRATEDSQQIITVARLIWDRLKNAEKLSKEELDSLLEKGGLHGQSVRAPSDLLKQLGLAVGVQRAGGLRRADLVRAEAEKQKVSPTPEQQNESQQDQPESAYYELMASLVDSWESYEAEVVGGEQIGRGEWSTPDVIGVFVQSAPSLVMPIVRVATVEVKLGLSRLAIAEATAHKRFAHYAYVGVPEPPVEMDPVLVAELSGAGLGLICPRQRGSQTFHVYLEPQLNRPDEEDVEQLLQRFSTSDKVTMSKATRDRVRKAIGELLQL